MFNSPTNETISPFFYFFHPFFVCVCKLNIPATCISQTATESLKAFLKDSRGQMLACFSTGITSLTGERSYAFESCLLMYISVFYKTGDGVELCVFTHIQCLLNDLCVESTITKAHVTTSPSSHCRDIRLQLAPDSEADTPPFPQFPLT